MTYLVVLVDVLWKTNKQIKMIQYKN